MPCRHNKNLIDCNSYFLAYCCSLRRCNLSHRDWFEGAPGLVLFNSKKAGNRDSPSPFSLPRGANLPMMSLMSGSLPNK